MLTPIANIHHSRLPPLGAIVTVRTRRLQEGCRYRRYVVEAYPLHDKPDLHSRGISTVYIRSLDNRRDVARVSGHWCHVEE
jgi:hypothetical protein